MRARLPLSQQKLQRLRQPPGPVGFRVLCPFRLEIAQGVLAVTLAAEQAVQRTRVLQRAGPLRRADVEIETATRRPRPLHEAQDFLAAKPDRRADDRGAAERGRPPEEVVQADQ